jgi:hypothetical protein
MARETRARITVKAPRLTRKEKEKLRKALRAAISIMDAHDLKTVTLDGQIQLERHRASKG